MSYFIIGLFVIWRVALFVIASFGEKVLSFSPRFPYSDVMLLPSRLPNWLWSFANFDGVHYLTIGEKGYVAQFTQVFFPLYPLMLGSIAHILAFLNPIMVGLFISNIFFLLSLFIFAKLLALDYKQESIKWILLMMIFFPTSFFFGSIYTESIFLFLTVSAFYAVRKKHWLLAGILGVLASSTRLIGIFLYPALLLEWYEYKIKVQNPKQSNIFHKVYYLVLTVLQSPLSLIPLGLLAYMLYLQVNFGDWLYFWHVQPVFGAARSGESVILLPQVLWRYTKILTSISPQNEAFWIPLLELVTTLGAFILLVVAYFKKIRSSYLLFSLLSVLTPTLTGTFSSMPRYILMALPVFIVPGMLKSRLVKGIILIVFTILLAALTILFTRGHWVA